MFYFLVPVFCLIPLNILFTNRGTELFALGSAPMLLYEAVTIIVCCALIAAGRILHVGSLINCGLLGIIIWLFRITNHHFPEDPRWPLVSGTLGLLILLVGVFASHVRRERIAAGAHQNVEG